MQYTATGYSHTEGGVMEQCLCPPVDMLRKPTSSNGFTRIIVNENNINATVGFDKISNSNAYLAKSMQAEALMISF